MSSDDEHILDEDASEDPKEVEGNIVDLEVDDLKVGLNFSTEEIALQSIENWSFKSLCALAKIRYRKLYFISCLKLTFLTRILYTFMFRLLMLFKT